MNIGIGVIEQRIALLEGNHIMLDNPFTRVELLAVYRLALVGQKVTSALLDTDGGELKSAPARVGVAVTRLQADRGSSPLLRKSAGSNPVPSSKRPGNAACLNDLLALKKRLGHFPTRRVFIRLSKTGRRYERLWKNYGAFIRDAKGE